MKGTETLNQMMAAADAGRTAKAADVRPVLSTDFMPPSTDLEIAIGSIWEDLFGISGIGVNDDFFELGGHSLLATQVLSRIRQSLSATLPLETLFEAPSIAGLASKVEAHRASKIDAISSAGRASESDIRRSVAAMSEEEVIAMLDAHRSRSA
jgi:acyl carrier protein